MTFKTKLGNIIMNFYIKNVFQVKYNIADCTSKAKFVPK